MLKQTLWAVIVVFTTWSIMDVLIHGIWLEPVYEATAHLWRSEAEMKMPLMSVVTLIFCICFVGMYSYLVEPKSLMSGIKYGVVFGVAMGVTMGLGSYCYMPIPLSLAISWFIGNFVEIALGGVIVGLMVKSAN